MAEIETGVDRLINLVKERKIVSVDEAAKILSVDTSMIENLAEILEDQGLVSIKYKMTNEFIIDKDFAASKKAGIIDDAEKAAKSRGHERAQNPQNAQHQQSVQNQQNIQKQNEQNLKKASADAKKQDEARKQDAAKKQNLILLATAKVSCSELEQEKKELKSIKSKFERAAKRKDKILSELSDCIKREEKAVSEIKSASSKRMFKILFPFTDKTKTEAEFRQKILEIESERKELEKKAKRLKESLRF